MISRRTFFVGCAACFVASDAFARDVGLSVSPGLQQAALQLSGLDEGQGKGTLFILYAPWCHAVPDFYKETRPFLDRMKLRWLPFSGGQIEGKIATEKLLSTRDPAQIPLNFPIIGNEISTGVPTPLSDEQDEKIKVFEKALIMETSHQIYIPTMLYKRADDRYRIIRGSINADDLAYIAQVL